MKTPTKEKAAAQWAVNFVVEFVLRSEAANLPARVTPPSDLAALFVAKGAETET